MVLSRATPVGAPPATPPADLHNGGFATVITFPAWGEIVPGNNLLISVSTLLSDNTRNGRFVFGKAKIVALI